MYSISTTEFFSYLANHYHYGVLRKFMFGMTT